MRLSNTTYEKALKMLLYVILCVLTGPFTIVPFNYDPITLIYPDVTERKVSFDFTVDENICQGVLFKTWNINANSRVVFEDNIAPQNGKIHIKFNDSFRIENIRDIGKIIYYPVVCVTPQIDYMVEYNVMCRPEFTISIDSNNLRRDGEMIINGNVTDWDSTKLTIVAMLNDELITKLIIEKNISSDSVPFSIKIPLKTAKLKENSITIIVTDDQGLSSNITKIVDIKGVNPVLSFPNNEINASNITNNKISIKLSVDDIDLTDSLTFLYSIDNQDLWYLIMGLKLTRQNQLPLGVELNFAPRLIEGNHSINLKCIDNNGLESKPYLVKQVSISKSSTNHDNHTDTDVNISREDVNISNTEKTNFPTFNPLWNFTKSDILTITIGVLIELVIFSLVVCIYWKFCPKKRNRHACCSDHSDFFIGYEARADVGKEVEKLYDLNKTTSEFYIPDAENKMSSHY